MRHEQQTDLDGCLKDVAPSIALRHSSATLCTLRAFRQPSESAQLAVFLSVALPLLRDGAFVKDGVHWALGLAGAALDAFVRVDVVHLLGLVDARDGADV